MYNNELYHFGIKGQKWGIRRFQNKDGTRTAAGKKRYQNDDGSLTKAGKKAAKKFEKNYRKNWTKPYNSASDEFNNKLQSINDKYNGSLVDSNGHYTKKGRAYCEELSKTWKSIYTKKLVEYFGKDPITNGTEWTKNALGMGNYDNLDD